MFHFCIDDPGFRRIANKSGKPKNAKQNADSYDRPWKEIVRLLFGLAQFAKTPARKRRPFETFDFLTAMAAKVWLVEHLSMYQQPVKMGTV